MESSIEVFVGQTFEILLPAGARTGFRWISAITKSQGKYVTLLEERTEARSAVPGAPAVQRFVFRALAPASLDLEFLYRRSWERAREPKRHVVHLCIRPALKR
jgi:predicted secreted protein